MSRELLWAVYGAIEALKCSSDDAFGALGDKWQAWLDYTTQTAAEV